MNRKAFLFVIIFIFSNLAIFGQIAAVTDANTDEIRQKTFDRVWNIVNERHFDKNFGGVDWKKVGENYRPKAMNAQNYEEFHAILNQMIGELNQSHFNIYTAESANETTKCNNGIIGIDLKLIGEQAIISRVLNDSPAHKANLKMGFAITKINDRSLPDILFNLEQNMAQRKLSDSLKQAYRERTLTRAICGQPETLVKIEALNQKNIAQTFEIKRVAFAGKIVKVAEGLPPFKLLFETRTIKDNIGYVSFNVWIPEQADKVRDAIRTMSNKKGIIIDLRNNAGGQGRLVNNVGGTMFGKEVSFGKSKTRFGSNDFLVKPQDKVFDGKVVILTDCGTGSTSEIFAAGMQETGRAKIIGERTAGAVLPANVERLPSGANIIYAVADYRTPNGILLEGIGVKPDIEIALTKNSLLEERDLQLEAAIKLIDGN